MRGRTRSALVGSCLVLLGTQLVVPARGDDPPAVPDISRPPAVEIVLDTSGSMSERDSAGTVKIEGARSAVLDYLQGAEPTSKLGILTYPSGDTDCGVGDPLVPIDTIDGAAVAAKVRTLTAKGGTPTGEALIAAKAQLDLKGAYKGSILLISDGLSTCPQKPCDVAKQLHDAGNAVQIDTVGFRVDAAGAEELRCIADAGGGRYIGVDDVKALGTQLAALSRPFLTVQLEPAEQVVPPDSGQGVEGLATITATISNDSDIPARDVQALLRVINTPDDPAGVRPGFNQPLSQYVGNVGPRAALQVQWSFRPGLSAVGRKVTFQVLSHADNTVGAASAAGSVTIGQLTTKDQAGPLLRETHGIVILGDSYSAGEGTGDYLAGQDEDPKHLCHRSDKTTLLPMLQEDGRYNLACSGAVTEDLESPNPSRDVDSQVNQLEAFLKTNRVDAAVMTMGGNDIGFADIIKSCLVREHCDRDIGLAFGREPSEKFLDDHFEGLSRRLADAYELITDRLNSDQARKRRSGALAPLVILAYPRILPGGDQGGCPTLATLGQGELDFATRLITRLNETIRTTVEEARKQGVPVWFVPNTEDAFLPNHTVCDGDSYARGLTEFRTNDTSFLDELKVAAGKATGIPLLDLYARYKVSQKRVQELFHPKIEGYQAMSLAILRWSRTADGQAAAAVPTTMAPKATISVDVAHPTVTLVVGGASQSVPCGAIVNVTVQGFQPQSTAFVNLQTDSIPLQHVVVSPDGNAQVQAVIPPRVRGHHDLVISGYDAQGQPRIVKVALAVTAPRQLVTPWRVALLGGGLILLCGSGLLLTSRRDLSAAHGVRAT